MTAYTSAQANARADANQPQPLTPAQVIDKYAPVFDRIWAAAGNGQYVLNLQLTDSQYSEFSPVLGDLGYGISPSLPTEVTTVATRASGITYTGYVNNGATAAGRQLTVVSVQSPGLSVGMPVVGTNIVKDTYITKGFSTRTTSINTATRLTTVITGNSTNNSVVLTNVSSFTGVAIGATITGTGIPADTIIQTFSVMAGTITLNRAATATAAGISLTFSTGFSIEISNAGNPTFTNGQQIEIDDCFPTDYNGTWTINTVTIGGSVTTISINTTAIRSNLQTTGIILTANRLVTQNGTVGVKTFTADYNNGFTLTNVSDFSNIIVGAPLSGSGLPAGGEVVSFDSSAGTILMSLPATGTGTATVSFPTFTIFTPSVTQWPIGMEVELTGMLPGQYNAVWTVSGSLNGSQFTVTPKLIQGWSSPGIVTQNGTVLGLGTGGAGFYTVNKTQNAISGTVRSSWVTVDSTQGFAVNGTVQFTPPSVITSAFQTVNDGNILVDSTDGLYEGMPIRFSGISLGGIQPFKTYYVKNALDGILTVSASNSTGITQLWTNDSEFPMTVIAGGGFAGAQPGITYYVDSIPDDDHVVISRAIGEDPEYLTSQRNWIPVTASTTAANLNAPVPVFTGETLGDVGNPYVVTWLS